MRDDIIPYIYTFVRNFRVFGYTYIRIRTPPHFNLEVFARTYIITTDV